MAKKNDEHELEYATSKITDADLVEYELTKVTASELYKTFGTIKCPAINTNSGEVVFTSEGFNHLIYRIKKQERHKKVQIMRFRLLPFAKKLLEKTTTIQEFEEYPREINTVHHGKHSKRFVQVKDYGFVGLIGKWRIKVVVRQIGEGKHQFCSVMPAWSTEYYRDIKIIRTTKGNVAED